MIDYSQINTVRTMVLCENDWGNVMVMEDSKYTRREYTILSEPITFGFKILTEQEILRSKISAIDLKIVKERDEALARMKELQEAKQELLALTFQEASVESTELASAYEHGKKAHELGRSYNDVPRGLTEDDNLDWHEGWRDADIAANKKPSVIQEGKSCYELGEMAYNLGLTYEDVPAYDTKLETFSWKCGWEDAAEEAERKDLADFDDLGQGN